MVPEDTRPLYEELSAHFLRWLEEGTRPPSPGVRWLPTHFVPNAGMPAWATPDPGSPVVANLDPGLPVQVVEEAGAWARVIASNGWTGWVDGRLLVPWS
ncbi:MAG: SH3 domain-containing protein [Actinobacteria bacterium]|nr:SH3 domain-containing protein [Actinomycetota bacterium]